MLIPLKKYINQWLDTYTVRDIFTGEIQTAREIFNWKKSYFLKLLIQDKYYIDTDTSFITKDKNYIRTIKTPLSQITPKKVKKFRVIGRKKVVDRYITETVDDYEPVEQTKYRMVNDYDNPIYDTVIKRRKIGKKYVWATEYIPTGKYHKIRQYYTVLRYVKTSVVKKRPIYKYVDILEPYYEQIRERTEDDYKTEVIEHRFYEPFFVFDYYKKLNEDEYDHIIYIAPFFDGYGTAIKIGSEETEIVNNRRLPVFISPQNLIHTPMYENAYRQCRYLIIEGKEKLRKKYLGELVERINNNEELHTVNLRESNDYSLDILKVDTDSNNGSGIIFFKATDVAGNSRKTII